MGLINLEPSWHPGEEVRWRRPAARSRDDRVVSGTLFASTLALVFMPNRLNRHRDLVSVRIPWQQVRRIDTVAPSLSIAGRAGGGLRRRLRVLSADPETGAELFVINHPEQIAIELRKLIPAAVADGPGPAGPGPVGPGPDGESMARPGPTAPTPGLAGPSTDDPAPTGRDA
jgi:hypothetical protein